MKIIGHARTNDRTGPIGHGHDRSVSLSRPANITINFIKYKDRSIITIYYLTLSGQIYYNLTYVKRYPAILVANLYLAGRGSVGGIAE